MATSGRRFRALAVALVLAGTAACSPAPPRDAAPPEGPVSPSRTAPSTAAPQAAAERAAPPPGRFCPVGLPAGWRTALDAGERSRHPGEQRTAVLVAPDGSLFVESFVPGLRHDLRWIPHATGRPVVVQRFRPDDAVSQQLGASFDGRYVAYSLLHGNRSFDDWTLHLWDSHGTEAPREIARSTRDGDGVALPGPLNYPLVHEGRVVWVQSTRARDRQTTIFAHDVATGRRTTLRAGHPGRPLRLGGLLLWPESPAPGALTRLHAVDYLSGAPAAVPAPVAGLTGPAFLATGGDTLAWSSQDLRQLWVWRTSWARPVLAVRGGDRSALQGLHVAGDVVTYDSGSEQWALDLRSGGYTPLTPSAGAQDTGGSRLWLMSESTKTPDGSVTLGRESVVDTRSLPPLPACGGRA